MLAKSFVLAVVATAFPVGVCDNMTVGDASRPDRASQHYVLSLIGPVKTRFATLTAASRCRQADNRFAYELLLSKLSGAGRAILEHAADEGVLEGRSVVSDPGDSHACAEAVDRFRAADDRLLLLAERLPR